MQLDLPVAATQEALRTGALTPCRSGVERVSVIIKIIVQIECFMADFKPIPMSFCPATGYLVFCLASLPSDNTS